MDARAFVRLLCQSKEADSGSSADKQVQTIHALWSLLCLFAIQADTLQAYITKLK